MILCLDVGNTQIFGGVYQDDSIVCHFRMTSHSQCTADEYGIFFRNVLSGNGVNPDKIDKVGICSVVPSVMYSLKTSIKNYFHQNPLVLESGVNIGLKIAYQDVNHVGADRIADAIGGLKKYPGKNLIIADFGTATTICAVSKEGVFLGGNIVPGILLSLNALSMGTAQLPQVEIKPMETAVGTNTIQSIQTGLYWANVGMIKELTSRMTAEKFADDPPIVIGTGGLSSQFAAEGIFDCIEPNLIHEGMLEFIRLNP